VISISAITCTHDPRPDYLRRTLQALQTQTLPKEQWEFLLVDNASTSSLAQRCDLSWHRQARYIYEKELGLTQARLRGIAEAEGSLLVFIDDDNVLAPDYLERAASISESNPHIGVFGAGALEPEFEAEPDASVRPWLGLLALRSVSQPTWTNHVSDYFCAPHGAGLCVPQPFAVRYSRFVRELRTSKVLDRHGDDLFCHGDDLFSWLSAGSDTGFGVFPQLRVTHLISKERVQRDYLIRLVRAHSFSHAVLEYMVFGTNPHPATALSRLRTIAHGLKNGLFSMRCRWAATAGINRAARHISTHRLQPVERAAMVNSQALAG